MRSDAQGLIGVAGEQTDDRRHLVVQRCGARPPEKPENVSLMRIGGRPSSSMRACSSAVISSGISPSMSTELVNAVNTSDASSDSCRTTSTLNVRGELSSLRRTVMRRGSMSGCRPSQPAIQVLTSALMTPTVRSGEHPF